MADPIAHPLGNLNVPSPEEYRKRKVALISGMCEGLWSVVVLIMCCFRYYWAGWVVFVGFPLSTRCVEKGVVDACCIIGQNCCWRRVMRYMGSSVVHPVSTLVVCITSMKTSTNVC